MFDDDNSQNAVLRAAMSRFSNYGYKRTSLNDIAHEAGLSRPTLYTYFKNKEAILRGVSQGLHDTTLANIEAAFATDADLQTQLVDGFWAWSEPYMSILFGSLHGAELMGASSAMAGDISLEARSRFQALLVKRLKKSKRSGELDLKPAGLTIEQAAEFLILALNGLSSGETDELAYRKRISALVRVFLIATQPKGETA